MAQKRWACAGAVLLLAGCGGTTSVSSASSPAPSAAPAATVAPTATPTGSPLPSTDTDAITNLVTEVEVIHDYQANCGRLFTSVFIAEAFGKLATCQKWGFPDLSDYPTSATVASIIGAGDSATGVVTDHGGIDDGATGPWQFSRNGGSWQVSDQGGAYLRATFSDQMGPNYHSQGAEDPFAAASYRSCVASAVAAADDNTVHAVVLGLGSHHSNGFGQLIDPCSAKAPNGVSPWRAIFETGLRQQAKGQLPSSIVDCLITGLRAAISDADLVDAMVGGADSTQMTNLDAQTTVITRKCAANTKSATPDIRVPEPKLGIRAAPAPTESAGPTPK